MTNIKLCPRCKQEKLIMDFTFTTGNVHSWCETCRNESNREWRLTNLEKANEGTRRYRRERKTKVLIHYGGNKLGCVRCGFNDIRALSIDHINGGGLKHLRNLKLFYGTEFYIWLIKNNYPEGYQTLCMNCQCIKRMENKEHGDGSHKSK